MNLSDHIKQIYQRQSELHIGRTTKSGTKRPDLLGYEVEDKMLSDYMVWLNNFYIATNPELVRDIFHIENEGTFGGGYGAMQGAISKGKGKKKGVLDVESVYKGRMRWFEFKNNEGKFSDEQLLFIGDLVENGVDVFIIKNDFDFWKFCIQLILDNVYLGGGVWKNIEQVRAKMAQI